MNDVQRIIGEIIIHCREIRKLCCTLEKRYGISICDVNPKSIVSFDSACIQVYRGFKELIKKLDMSVNDICGDGTHFHIMYGKTEICTVTNGTKRFRAAARRNNKWTRGEDNHESDT